MIRKALPSFVTSLGLLAGCMSVTYASSGDLYTAGWFILAASLFDFADGFVARLFDSITEFGKQLDSLADVVSFGVAPAMILSRLMMASLTGDGSSHGVMGVADVAGMAATGYPKTLFLLLAGSPFLIVVFSALRLAHFNLDKDQVYSFKGLATPANAIWVAGIAFMANEGSSILSGGQSGNPWFYLAFTIVSCALLVSNIRMFSLKFKTYEIRTNIIRYVFLAASAVLLATAGLPALAWIIVIYVALSLLNHWIFRLP